LNSRYPLHLFILSRQTTIFRHFPLYHVYLPSNLDIHYENPQNEDYIIYLKQYNEDTGLCPPRKGVTILETLTLIESSIEYNSENNIPKIRLAASEDQK
jgi:hypothetical protein